MSGEENKQIARRFINAFLAGDTAVLEEIVAQDFVEPQPAALIPPSSSHGSKNSGAIPAPKE